MNNPTNETLNRLWLTWRSLNDEEIALTSELRNASPRYCEVRRARDEAWQKYLDECEFTNTEARSQ